MDMQAPIFEMNLRGVLTNRRNMVKLHGEYKAKKAHLQSIIDRICIEGLGLESGFNVGSHVQVKHFFYNVLGIPVVKEKNSKGFMAPSSSRTALEKCAQYFYARPFVNLCLAIRDVNKKLSFLETPIGRDKRLYTSFNLAGTTTGRLNSKAGVFGNGTNAQNTDKDMRYMLVPDPGKVFVNVDLEQADSRNVGALAWNMFVNASREEVAKAMGLDEWHGPIGEEFAGSYLDACESGDLHTTVCRMAWSDLDWAEDQKDWRATADEIAYRGLSYRDMAKKLGHGTNYLGKPKTMAGHTKVAVEIIAEFQKRYSSKDGAFPVITAWQNQTIHQLQTQGYLTHLLGRRRCFFGKLDNPNVINEAIAYCPQGMTGDFINHGILRLWRDPDFELLIQVHDSVLFQIDQKRIEELVPRALAYLHYEIPLDNGRKFSIPVEAKVGWNGGDAKFDKKTGLWKNPEGLVDWTGEELRAPPKPYRPKRTALRDLF
jgi:DNA polymerase I-like protein with 3'-5' exonuclease and polymerase domains